jgi:hypothetical protein
MGQTVSWGNIAGKIFKKRLTLSRDKIISYEL